MKLKEYIEQEDMTVAQFSRRVKVTPRSISRILDLGFDISLSLAIRIQRATRNKVKVEELISEKVIWAEKNKHSPKIKTNVCSDIHENDKCLNTHV